MKKLYIETYGCQMNVADSEVVASVNTCSVRENAENKIYRRLEALHAENRKGKHRILGVLGCMAERVRDDLITNHHADLVAGPDAYLNLPDLIAQAELGLKAINIELSSTARRGEHPARGAGLAAAWLQGGDLAWAECQLLPLCRQGPRHRIPPAVAHGGGGRACHACEIHHIPSQGHER